ELRQITYRKLRELDKAKDSRDLRNTPSNHFEKLTEQSAIIVHPGEVLREDFLLPLKLAPEKLAENIKVNHQVIQELIEEKRDLDKDLATRLALYFDMINNQAQQHYFNMVRIDKNRVQQLEKELKDIAVPNHQYKKEQLTSLENLLVKESRKTRREEHKEKLEKISLKSPNNQQLELAKYLNQELNNQRKSKEEKAERIINFCLDYLNQGVREDWRKSKNKTQILLTLAENE
ncbi:35000_t:CDS:2, partial [Gigaspora margarita]